LKILLIGFGIVGQGLAQILEDKAEALRSHQQIEIKIVGVATRSHGLLYHPDGLQIAQLLHAAQAGSLAHYPAHPGLIQDWPDVETLIREAEADILVEVSPSNLNDAQPALRYCEAALQSGKHVVLANKGPVAVAYEQLQQLATQHQKQLRMEATVMSGTPAIATGLEMLAGCRIHQVQGILNGTTNYMLTQMENGLSYAEALAQAQALGYAETDPTADVEGWDAAGKVLILLAALFGKNLRMTDLEVSGITQITLADIQAAQQTNERYKLIATATREGGRVQPQRIPISEPLAGVGGAANAITFSTDIMGAITLIGAGAGQRETGYALLADILAIHRQNIA